MHEMVPPTARLPRPAAGFCAIFLALLTILAAQQRLASAQSAPVTDWTDADLAAAAALRDRALKGT